MTAITDSQGTDVWICSVQDSLVKYAFVALQAGHYRKSVHMTCSQLAVCGAAGLALAGSQQLQRLTEPWS